MKEKSGLLGYYNYTVILTYLGMLLGFAGITFVLKGKYYDAVICLMTAGICDMFDGKIASTRKRTPDERKFGIQIGSLSDLLCFGLLPALFVYQFEEKSNLSFVIAALYVLCALVRLSYFNVCEEKRQEQESTERSTYQGLPVTTAALFLPAVYLLALKFQKCGPVSFLCLLFGMALLFLLPIRIRKPHLPGKIIMALLGLLELLILMTGGFVK